MQTAALALVSGLLYGCTIAAALPRSWPPEWGLLVVEQTMAAAGRVAQRFLFMEDGRVVADLGGGALAADPGLFDRYLGVGKIDLAARTANHSPCPTPSFRRAPGE